MGRSKDSVGAQEKVTKRHVFRGILIKIENHKKANGGENPLSNDNA